MKKLLSFNILVLLSLVAFSQSPITIETFEASCDESDGYISYDFDASQIDLDITKYIYYREVGSDDWIAHEVLSYTGQIRDLAVAKYQYFFHTTESCMLPGDFEISYELGCLQLEEEITHSCDNFWTGEGNGSISVSVSGGILPYTYMWNTGETTPDISVLDPGQYTLLVADAQGSVSFATYIVEENNPVIVSNLLPANGQGAISLEITIFGNHTPYMVGPWIGFPGNPPYQQISANGGSVSFLMEQPPQNDIISFRIFSLTGGCDIIHDIPINLDCFIEPENYSMKVSSAPFAPGYSDAACDINGQLKISSSKGTPPYQITVDLVSSIYPVTDPVGNPFPWVSTLYSDSEEVLYNPIIEGQYHITSVDACGYIKSELYNMCTYCGYHWDDNKESFVFFETQPVDYETGVEIEVECACDADTDCNRKLKVKTNVGYLYQIFEYTVVWPDGTEYVFTYNGGDEIEENDSDLSEWSPPSNSSPSDEYTFTVERSDGCVIPVTFSFGGENQNISSVYLEENLDRLDLNSSLTDPEVDFGITIDAVYMGVHECEICNLENDDFQNFVLGENFDCDEVTSVIYFTYQPTDPNNPCNGGGTLSTFNYVNGQVEQIDISIPPGIAVGEAESGIYGGIAMFQNWSNLSSDIYCTDGGGCLFSTYDVFELQSSYPVFVSYCDSYQEWPEDEDEDGDGCHNDCDPNPEHDPYDCDCDGDGCPNHCDPSPDDYDTTDCDCNGDTNGGNSGSDEFPCDVELAYIDEGCDIKVKCGEEELGIIDNWDVIIPCAYYYNDDDCNDIRALCLIDCGFEYLETTQSVFYPGYTCADNLPSCGSFCDGLGQINDEDKEAKLRSIEDNFVNSGVHNKIILFPNPALSKVTITSTWKPFKEIMIFDSYGRQIINKKIENPFSNNGVLDVSNLYAGIYFVQVLFYDNTSDTERIIKK